MTERIESLQDGLQTGGTAGVENWSDYWNRRMIGLGPAAFSEINERLRAESIRHGLWWEINRGLQEALPLLCRPRLMDLSCRGYVHHVTWQIRMGLRRVIKLVEGNREAAELVPMAPQEEDWLRRYRRPLTSWEDPAGPKLFCRLDAFVNFDGPGWRETLKFMETNGIGTGGIAYAPAAEELFLEIVAPVITGDEEELAVDRNADPRLLLHEELVRHARSLRMKGEPRIAFVDDRSLYTFGGEFGRLTSFFEERGFSAVYVDPQEVQTDARGRLYAGGQPVHVCFRFLELAELAEMESRGQDLHGVRAAFSEGRMIPSVGGDLEHKSVFELLSNPDFYPFFSSEQLRVFQDHVLWTRLLFERRTSVPDGETTDLVKYVRASRSGLVLKPNRGYGGEGVVIGECLTESQWDDAVQQALIRPKTYIVQRAATPDIEDFPEQNADGLGLGRYYSTAGFFPCRTGLGVFGRCAKHPVVNLLQGGSVVPFLVNVR